MLYFIQLSNNKTRQMSYTIRKIQPSKVLALILQLVQEKDTEEARRLANELCTKMGIRISAGYISEKKDVHFLAHSLIMSYGKKMTEDVELTLPLSQAIPKEDYPLKTVDMLDEIFRLAKEQAGYGKRS
jgi:hypothetical protein